MQQNEQDETKKRVQKYEEKQSMRQKNTSTEEENETMNDNQDLEY